MRAIFARATGFFKRDLYLILLFTSASLVSLYLRHNILPVLTHEPIRVLSASPDSSSYLRIFDLTIARFPSMPGMIDYYANYPGGFRHTIPPTWPYLLAVPAWLASKVAHTTPLRAAGVLMLIIGASTAISIYYLTKELFERRVALFTAAFTLLMPILVIISYDGIDHHIVDILLVPLVFAFFLNARQCFIENNRSRLLWTAFIGGALATLALTISLSLMLIFAMLLLPIILAIFILTKEDVKSILIASSALFGFTTFFLAILAVATQWVGRSWSFSELSFLHLGAFGAIAAFSIIGFLALSGGMNFSAFRITTGIIIALTFCALWLVPPLLEIVLKGYWRSIGNYPVGMNTKELAPLIADGPGRLIYSFSYFIFLAPIPLVAMLVNNWRKDSISFENLFFYSMLASLGFYTFEARYYTAYFAIFIVMLYGLGTSQLIDILFNALRRFGYSYLHPNIIYAAVAMIALAIMSNPSLKQMQTLIDPNLFTLTRFMKAKTPSPGNFLHPDKRPAYSVMCDWSYGFQIQYLAERPVVATGNHETAIDGVITSEGFYQTSAEDEGLEILNRHGVKYVVATRWLGFWEGDMSKLGEPSANPDEVVVNIPLDAIDKSRRNAVIASRLYDGAFTPTKDGQPPLHHFRLIAVSNAVRSNEMFALYEVVKGAHMQVVTAPNLPVSISTNIITNDRRSIPWRIMGRSDSHGVFSTILPYATKGNNLPIVTEPYWVQVGYNGSRIDVDEGAIENGNQICIRVPGKS